MLPPGSLSRSTYFMWSRPSFSPLRAVRLPAVMLPPSTFACCSARSSATAAEPSTLMAPAFTPQTWALAVAWPKEPMASAPVTFSRWLPASLPPRMRAMFLVLLSATAALRPTATAPASAARASASALEVF